MSGLNVLFEARPRASERHHSKHLFAVIVGACLFGACSNSDVSAQLEATESLVAEFALTQTTGPSEVDSVTFRHVTASGLMDGDQEDVVRSVEERLTAAGWSVVLVEPLDVSGSPASEEAGWWRRRTASPHRWRFSIRSGQTRHPWASAGFRCPWLDPAIPSSGRVSTERRRHRLDRRGHRTPASARLLTVEALVHQRQDAHWAVSSPDQRLLANPTKSP